jgi:hypothetical protein
MLIGSRDGGTVQGAGEVLCLPVFLVCHVGDEVVSPLVMFSCSATCFTPRKVESREMSFLTMSSDTCNGENGRIWTQRY